MGPGKTLSRNELYRMVWAEPISRIARDFGLSDVGLAKLCQRHDIPRPPRGYWAQRQHGHEPRQVPLPNPGHDPQIDMGDREPRPAPEAAPASEGGRPTAETPAIAVADSLRGGHALVSRANQELEGAATDSDGIVVAAEGRALDVRTSKGCVRRALLILDALLKECERRGYMVSAGPAITIQGHEMKLGISEAVETTREEAGGDDNDLRGSYSFGHSRFTSKRVPTGRLTLAVTEGRGYWAGGSRSTWRDTDRSKLEDRLGKVLVGLVEIAGLARRHEEEQERRREAEREAEARRQEAARQLAERRKAYAAEKARLTQLLQHAENLGRSRLLRELIEAVRSRGGQPSPVVPDGDTAAWIEWATRQADRLDPLLPSPPSILDEKLEDEGPPGPGRPPYDSASSPSYWEQRNWWNRSR